MTVKTFKELNKGMVDRLIEPIAFIDEKTYYALSNILGVELIVTSENAPNGKYTLSRLGLANSFINNAMIGLRLAVKIDDDGKCSGINFVDLSKRYSESDLEYAKQMHERKVLGSLIAIDD